ncbi:MAG: guanylate kinase [Verrucomicrobiia bacterium]|jgi:guanylate kinase
MSDSPTPSKALLVLVSAPSGAGKTTLCQKLLDASPHITRAITCTTRAPRGAERDGVDYYFLSEREFQDKVAAGEFLEHANVYGRHYGTLLSEALDKLKSGKDVLLNIDVQGAATIRANAGETPEIQHALVSVFLTPPSMAELERRLRSRGEDDEAAIQKRLALALHEIEQWSEFDYLLISETVSVNAPEKDEDLRRMFCILEAEKMRRERSHPPAN